ncbi:MAG: M56 family metallopeptidase [Bacteroidia bacterium]|nr:M56 family metallopeptidase [Bacteroidia bacterium]
MISFLIYEVKAAIVLLVFYLFYRFLLKKETFHRFNRAVLVGTAVLSFILPLCVITIRRPVEVGTISMASAVSSPEEVSTLIENSGSWWPIALIVLFAAGAVFVLVRVVVSILSIKKKIHQGETVQEEDGCRIIVTENDVDPFSWMRYVVISRTDWESNHSSILAHEKAHVKSYHSVELLLVDIMSAFQWFNPAIWMLRADLQELHEYEADDAVLQSGADIKEYQYLLLRKAVGKSGYSVANSLNHSLLKNRITMMTKTKSPLSRGFRALYVLPLLCLCLGLQAQTVNDPDLKFTKNGVPYKTFTAYGSTPSIYILRQVWGEEQEITKEEYEKIDQSRIKQVEVLQPDVANEKYGDRAANGVVVITMKRPQELDEIFVISYKEQETGAIPMYIVKPDTMPTFQGEGMQAFSRWLNMRIARPKGCNHVGKMNVSFVVDTDGAVKDVKVLEGICEELDNLVVSLIEQSPKWEPATVNGQPEPQCLTIPITFQMR